MSDLNHRYEKSLDLVVKILFEEVRANQLEVDIKFETSKDSLAGCYIETGDSHIITISAPNIKAGTKSIEAYFYNLLFVPYHEFMHRIYRLTASDNMDFKNTISSLAIAIKNINPEFYKTKHDDFYEEIIADYYAVFKARQFMNKHPRLIEKLQDISDYYELSTELRLINYDFEQMLNYFVKTYKTSSLALTDNKLISTFFDENKCYKPLNQIVNSQEFALFDDDSKYSILASKSFLTSQDYSKLSEEEIELLIDSINYSYQIELNRALMNENLKEKLETTPYRRRKTNEIEKLSRVLDPILNKKQIRNIAKRKYLKQEMTKLNSLLTTSKTFKKM